LGEIWRTPARWAMTRLSSPMRVNLIFQHGSVHLAAAAAATEGRRAALLRVADRDVRALRKTRGRYAVASAFALHGALAASRGEVESSRALAAQAEAAFEAIGQRIHAAAARRRRGELLGGEEGAALIESADATMRAQAIVDPARMTSALLPGRWS